jgi:hypothetical protein
MIFADVDGPARSRSEEAVTYLTVPKMLSLSVGRGGIGSDRDALQVWGGLRLLFPVVVAEAAVKGYHAQN